MSHPSDLQPHPAPKLTVVGAGIGDPDLITLKAVKAIQSADIILYDALVNKDLLNHAPLQSARIYVGKRRAHKAFSQDEINEIIVSYARHYGHVVRLKGGDPFMFGRGLEEMQYAEDHGVETHYIPGVSSAIAGPGAAGIAVTLRGIARSCWILTATTDTGALNPEIRLAAQTDTTVVILMGLSKLAEISAVFEAAGKGQLPVAIVQNASLPDQHTVFGTVANIEQKMQSVGKDGPAVIVLGEVVRNHLRPQKIATTVLTQAL